MLLGIRLLFSLGNESYRLPITFCFSIEELSEIYGIDFNFSFDNFEVYFGIESGGYSPIEVIGFEPIGVDNFLFLFVDKNGGNLDYGDAYFFRNDGQNFLLLGNYEASSMGIVSQGVAYLDGFDLTFSGEFSAEVNCN